MTVPSFILGMVIPSIFGAVFHLLIGGGFGRLILYILLAWIGFWGGHFLGNSIGLTFFSLGVLRLGSASIGSIFTLIIGHWLSLVRKK